MNSNILEIEFFIPILPIAKERPRSGKFGFYTPSKTKCFELEIRKQALCARQSGGIHEPISSITPLYARIEFYFPIPSSKIKKINNNDKKITKPDIDNLIKSTLDGLQGIIFEDDKQICSLYSSKMYHHEMIGIYIYITDEFN